MADLVELAREVKRRVEGGAQKRRLEATEDVAIALYERTTVALMEVGKQKRRADALADELDAARAELAGARDELRGVQAELDGERARVEQLTRALQEAQEAVMFAQAASSPQRLGGVMSDVMRASGRL